MVDKVMIAPIRAAIRMNELGSASPYQLSFACLGQSGASFGIFQGDTNVNHTARAVLREALALTADGPTCDRIIGAVSQPCPTGCPLSDGDLALANAALSSTDGMTLVDGMDDALLQVVLNEVDTSIAASATVQATLAPPVQIYVALWVNMTGAPKTLNAWLSGTPELGLGPPAPPTVTRQAIEAYLQATTYFHLHPRNFLHMQQSVNAGLAALAAAAAQTVASA
jgi:hypothetical protein